MNKYLYLPLFGLALVFTYFGIDKFIHPEFWMGWIPEFIDGLLGISKPTWNSIFGVQEIVFAILLLIPKTRRIGAALMALFIIPIIIMTWPSDIAVRDFAILTIAAFFAISKTSKKAS